MTPQTPATPSDLLEQAHLALLRGHWDQAQSLSEQALAAEPGNAAAQDLRATAIARQAAALESDRLRTLDATPPASSDSIWTRPLRSPTSALLDSPSARKWPKPLLLVVCLLAGVVTSFLPSRHHHTFYHSSWKEDVVFGLVGGLVLFVLLVTRKRG